MSESMLVPPPQRPPLVVVVNGEELMTRTLESVLGPHGFAVLRAYNGRQALERCRAARPDAIILDTDLPDMDGLEVCRTLRLDPLISRGTAILVTSPRRPSREARIAAMRAGAWDFLGDVLDDDELPLRLATYVRAKFEADRTREESHVDAATGMYNTRGLARRARELGSQAYRHREPLVCVVFSVAGEPDVDASATDRLAAAVERLASTLRERGRLSDAAGRLGPAEFAVIAEGIDAAGARRMADRLTTELRAGGDTGGSMRVVAGFDAVDNYRETPRDPAEMLARASRAMQQSLSDTGGQWIRQAESGAPN